MDAIDEKILAILRAESRISLRELGQRIHLSSSAVGERLRKLEENGVIRGYPVVIDEKQLGFVIHAFVFLALSPPQRQNRQPALAYLAGQPQIHRAGTILSSGQDYLLEVFCPDLAALEQIQQELSAFGATTTYLAGEEALPRPWMLSQP